MVDLLLDDQFWRHRGTCFN